MHYSSLLISVRNGSHQTVALPPYRFDPTVGCPSIRLHYRLTLRFRKRPAHTYTRAQQAKQISFTVTMSIKCPLGRLSQPKIRTVRTCLRRPHSVAAERFLVSHTGHTVGQSKVRLLRVSAPQPCVGVVKGIAC